VTFREGSIVSGADSGPATTVRVDSQGVPSPETSLWLAKVLSIQQVRKEVELMELESKRFYQTAKRTANLSVGKLLDELAVAEQVHEDPCGQIQQGLGRLGGEEGRGSNPSADVTVMTGTPARGRSAWRGSEPAGRGAGVAQRNSRPQVYCRCLLPI
jgi:hypothetical protein